MVEALLVAFAIVLFFSNKKAKKKSPKQDKCVFYSSHRVIQYINVSFTLSGKFYVILSAVKNSSGWLFELASL